MDPKVVLDLNNLLLLKAQEVVIINVRLTHLMGFHHLSTWPNKLLCPHMDNQDQNLLHPTNPTKAKALHLNNLDYQQEDMDDLRLGALNLPTLVPNLLRSY
jgi:hypothetical protein